jgi:hypothetical protein
MATNSSDASVAARLADFRCLLLARGVPATPLNALVARSPPSGPVSRASSISEGSARKIRTGCPIISPAATMIVPSLSVEVTSADTYLNVPWPPSPGVLCPVTYTVGEAVVFDLERSAVKFVMTFASR